MLLLRNKFEVSVIDGFFSNNLNIEKQLLSTRQLVPISSAIKLVGVSCTLLSCIKKKLKVHRYDFGQQRPPVVTLALRWVKPPAGHM